MFGKLEWIAAILVAIAAPPTAAQPAPAAADEALIDRFIAALPDARRLGQVDRTPDPEELDRLGALNPGKADEVRAVLEAQRACESAALDGATEDLLRNVARSLGAARLERLIQFYESDDLRVFDAMRDRTSRGETLSDAEAARLERMVADYPLLDFYQGFQAAHFALAENPEFLTAIDVCTSRRRAALAERGLRAD